MAKFVRKSIENRKSSEFVADFEYRGITYRVNVQMTTSLQLPAYMNLADPRIFVDHSKLTDRVFELARVTPSADLWNELYSEVIGSVEEEIYLT